MRLSPRVGRRGLGVVVSKPSTQGPFGSAARCVRRGRNVVKGMAGEGNDVRGVGWPCGRIR